MSNPSQHGHDHADPPTARTAPHACCSSNAGGGAAALRDPVCGMAVDPATSTHHARFEGHDHYFCSAGCRTRFIADPHKYLQPAESSAPAVPGAQYTCPMHPEILRDAQGACPLCGMASTVDARWRGDNPELVDLARFGWTRASIAPWCWRWADNTCMRFRRQCHMVGTVRALRGLWRVAIFVRWAQSIGNRSPNMGP